MYAAQMTTPNAIRFDGQPAEPLLEAAGAAEAATYIASAPCTQSAIFDVADHVQQVVRDSLHYPEEVGDWLTPIGTPFLESMALHGQTNCLGYAHLGSQILSLAGVAHYVAYGNSHWFLLQSGANEAGEALFTRDMLKPEFNGDVTNALTWETPTSIAANLEADPNRQRNVMFDTQVIANWLGLSLEDMVQEYPAFWRRPGDAFGSHSSVVNCFGGKVRLKERFQWVLSIYTPEKGRQIIERHDRFLCALSTGQTALALDQLEAMDGAFPDNDCRNGDHAPAHTLVSQMCADDTLRDQAGSAIESYCGSIRTGDARVEALRAQLYRRVAKHTGDPDALRRASQAYAAASERSKIAGFRETYLAKSQKASKLATAGQ